MLIGYARVSTQDQNLELQTEALTKAGCKKVFEDKISGGRASGPVWPKRRNPCAKVTRWSSGNWIGWAAASSTSLTWSVNLGSLHQKSKIVR